MVAPPSPTHKTSLPTNYINNSDSNDDQFNNHYKMNPLNDESNHDMTPVIIVISNTDSSSQNERKQISPNDNSYEDNYEQHLNL